MRRYTLLTLALISALSVAACSLEGALEEEPVGFLSTENFYETPEDAKAALVYAYAILGDIEYYSRHFYMVRTVPTAEFTVKPDAGASGHALDDLRTTSTTAMLTDVFRYAYIGINRANAVIQNVPDIQMDEERRNQIVGEGYFLRALHYFNLVRLFGDVPIHTSVVDERSETSKPLSPKEEVYQLIIDDLTTASKLMDQVPRTGRANQVAAWSLLSKVYLYLASAGATGVPGYEFVSNPDKYYDLAAKWAGKVVHDQSIYHLNPDLKSIYNVHNEDGPEKIFYVAHARNGEHEGMYSKLPHMMAPYIDGAEIRLKDGLTFPSGYNHLIVETAFFNSFSPDDKRRSVLIPDTVFVDSEMLTYPGGGLQKPLTRKFVDAEQVSDRSGTDTPVLRFSDILLVYAEAVGPTPEGYAAINAIRNRAGLPDLTPGLSVQAFRDSVLRERRWELAFEGQTLFDLRRTHKMEEVLEGQYGKTIESNAYYYDIPQVERDINEAIN